jgi:hypothetical protein
MVYGSSYIYVEFFQNVDFKSTLPTYVIENFPSDVLATSIYKLPKYVMIKFRGKDYNIDKAYDILKISLNGREWNVKIFNNFNS